jgi:plasmid maintenance system antidote protein VapI
MTRQPANPIHPGMMLLEEFLLPAGLGLTQTAFADCIRRTHR